MCVPLLILCASYAPESGAVPASRIYLQRLIVACGALLPAYLLTHVLTTTHLLFYSLRCQGCMESTAFNHDPSANLPGVCTSVIPGCLDSLSLNFYPGAKASYHPSTPPPHPVDAHPDTDQP